MEQPYPIPVGVIEPGDGDPATRMMARITAGTAYARAQGFHGPVVHLNHPDYALYERANIGLPGELLPSQTVCDGATIVRQDDLAASYFTCFDQAAQPVRFFLMTDGQFLDALNLKAGMFVVREGDLQPQELLKDPLTMGVLRVGRHRYDSKGHALKHNVPAILYAWDKDAMEAKAGRGELTDMEKAFFATLMQHQQTTAFLESLSATRQ